MSTRKRRRKRKNEQAAISSRDSAAAGVGEDTEGLVPVGDWSDRKKPIWRRFPGPRQAGVALRVAFERRPYAELVGHAKESLDREVCGVLVGDVCEDEEGLFVDVKATIRGAAARAGSTHVTFTQETWNEIHGDLEQKYPDHAIVGWYHSHPGFGVTFSDMDVFVQQNFFPGAAHIALVTDPLGGSEAICMNGPDGIEYLDRFWVDGRERRISVPDRGHAAWSGSDSDTGVSAEAFERLEARITQLLRTVEEQRAAYNRLLLSTGMIVAVAVVLFIGYSVYSRVTDVSEPPRLRSYVPIPVQVGEERVLLGVGVVDWIVPPELNAAYIGLEERRREREQREGANEPERSEARDEAEPAAADSARDERR